MTRKGLFKGNICLNKSRKSFSATIVVAMLLLIEGCGGNELDIEDEPLQGVIDTNSWTYGAANAFRRSADGLFEAKFLSSNESTSDPCAVPSPGLAHVKAIFRPAIQSYSISPQVITATQVQVAFQASPSRVVVATNGFMEIFDINNGFVIGYLQAELDNEYAVEGSFEMILCN